ncbi:trigger factor [uncultured Desulfovibrio sp.]|uniref:trigger factor n=1 Tax=uncultured Desulfovibrio sp. TaxID=167968 RepID=UPI0032079568
MEYTIEELSPVKRKISIVAEASDVDDAIARSVAYYRKSVQIDGFRKGKVPASVVEKRFHDYIYEEARQALVNAKVGDALAKAGLEPVSGIQFVEDGGALARGKGLSFSVEFEVLPAFELPAYEGMEVEKEKAVVTDEEVDAVIERIRRDRAELLDVAGEGPAVDGQIANISFEAFEDGKSLGELKTDNFDLPLGEGQALDDFEKLVKTVKVGQTGEGDIVFPANIPAQSLAGKTLKIRVTVHAVKQRKLPEINDDLARQVGVESMDKLRASIRDSYAYSRENAVRSAAQKKMLDKMLAGLEFPLPESLLDMQIRTLIAETAARLEQQGKKLADLGKTEDELRKELQKQAEELTRIQVLLLSIARKEGLSVSQGEVDNQLYRICIQTGEDFRKVREAYERTGMINTMRDRLLADKGMEAAFAKAKVREVEPMKEITPVKKDAAPIAD